MDYEEMWNELKEFVNDKCQMEYDDIPKYIYDIICNKMDNMEFRNRNITEHGDYGCIKNYNCVFTEGAECFILSEDDKYYNIESCDGYMGLIEKDKFDEYFQLIRE